MGFSGHGVTEGLELAAKVKSVKPQTVVVLATSVPLITSGDRNTAVDYYHYCVGGRVEDKSGAVIYPVKVESPMRTLASLINRIEREDLRTRL